MGARAFGIARSMRALAASHCGMGSHRGTGPRRASRALAIGALAREAAADDDEAPKDEPPEAIRSRDAVLAGVGMGIGGAAVLGAGLGMMSTSDGGFGGIGAAFGGAVAAWVGGSVLTAGVPVAMVGALRNKPRNKPLAVTGIPIAALGAGALAVGAPFMLMPNHEVARPTGIAFTAAGAGLSVVGVTLYLLGNRRAEGPASALDADARVEMPSVTVGPAGAALRFRF
jgi:hypothetical protein